MMDAMEIVGYLTAEDAEALRGAVADVLARQVAGDVVEIGSYHGRSTVVLAQGLRGAGRRLLSIDPHEGLLNADDGLSMLAVAPTLGALRGNLARFGVADLVDVHVGTVDDAPLPAEIALAFIDGLHDAWHVRHDAQALRPRMAPGGLMLFHDYDALWPGVVDVVNELYEQDTRVIWLPTRGVVAGLQVR